MSTYHFGISESIKFDILGVQVGKEDRGWEGFLKEIVVS